MSALKIVHITPTPLVGAPGKIAYTQRLKGHDAIAVALSDYPQGGPLKKMFLDRSLMINNFTRDYIETSINQANIIHIHNYLPDDRVSWLKELNQSANLVYQTHSYLCEGPLYVDRTRDTTFDFRLKLVVAQHQVRLFPHYVPVPNLVLSAPSIRLRRINEKLRVMFSPTHKRDSRWGGKYSHRIEEILNSLSNLGIIDVISPEEPIPPETLIEIRRSCHISIDEIATGGFHMVSLEAMCVGNIAINRADYFAKSTFASFCEGEVPPFLYADDGCIADILLELSDDWEKTAHLQQQSYNYFIRYCNPLRLVEVFDEAYQCMD